jgi:hypothetical protein
MSIRKGSTWGAPGALAAGAPLYHDDRSAALALQHAVEHGAQLGEIGLLGGDLHRTLGAPRHDEQDLRAGRAMRFPMDLCEVRLDAGAPQLFLAHMVATPTAGGRLWSGRTITAMNATFCDGLDLGPRAHPGDGRLDVTDGFLPLGERRAGRRRARTGSHVPHPQLHERRVRQMEIELDRPLHVRLDGELVGRARRLELRCLADAVVVVV